MPCAHGPLGVRASQVCSLIHFLLARDPPLLVDLLAPPTGMPPPPPLLVDGIDMAIRAAGADEVAGGGWPTLPRIGTQPAIECETSPCRSSRC